MSGSSCHLGLATRLLIVWTYLHCVVWKTSNSRKKPCVPLLLPEVAVSMPFAATLQLLPHVATPLLDPRRGAVQVFDPWVGGRCGGVGPPDVVRPAQAPLPGWEAVWPTTGTAATHRPQPGPPS